MAAVESAVYNLLGVFHKYSAKEGDNLKLNKSELSTMLVQELPCCYTVSHLVIISENLNKSPIIDATLNPLK
uniref:S100/CaBP-9k-type calcium binding subdomain domain-containing protein n=1 Tax=Leptobrachium leishanense TaxID=445787 RepID=A0A8C5PTE4_9ANUR